MHLPATIPAPLREQMSSLVQALQRLRGVEAIVLGGSHARGTAKPGSDVDLGVYYRDAAPFSIDDIRRLASTATETPPPVVTDFYEWGPWVNGGAWIRTRDGKIDLLYRSIEHVARVIGEAQAGRVAIHFEQQPPYGFHSVIYLAETNVCVPLFDPAGVIAALKSELTAYPRALRRAIVQQSLWSAEFTLAVLRTARTGEVYFTTGCLTRVASALTQALFALNEVYFISDKGAPAAIDGFATAPTRFSERLASVLGAPGRNPEELDASAEAVAELWREVVELAGEMYAPKYRL